MNLTHRDVTEDVLVSTDLPTTFNGSVEFEEGQDFESISEFYMSITTET